MEEYLDKIHDLESGNKSIPALTKKIGMSGQMVKRKETHYRQLMLAVPLANRCQIIGYRSLEDRRGNGMKNGSSTTYTTFLPVSQT